MRRRLMGILLVLALTLALLPVSALAAEIEIVEPEPGAAENGAREYREDGFVFSIEDGAATLIAYEGEETAVEIPAAADGAPVTAIGPRAFSGNKTIVSVALPSSVERIEDGEMIGFSVYDGEKVFFVDEGTYAAFYDCDALVSVTAPDDARLSTIGEWSFWFCDALSQVTLPPSIRTLALSCFQDCPALTSIVLPEGLEWIGQNAFTGSGLTSLALPASLRELHPWIYMDHLESFTVAEGNAFYRAEDGVLYAKGTLFFDADPEGWYLWMYPTAKPDRVYTPPAFVGEDLNLDMLNGGVTFDDLYSPLPYLETVDIGSRRFDFISYTTYNVEVDEDSPWYTLRDGMLYTKDMSTLLVVPYSLTGTLRVDSRAASVADMAGFAPLVCALTKTTAAPRRSSCRRGCRAWDALPSPTAKICASFVCRTA